MVILLYNKRERRVPIVFRSLWGFLRPKFLFEMRKRAKRLSFTA